MSTSLCHFSSVFCIIGANFIITDIFTERTAWQLGKKGKSGWGGDQEHREVDFEVKNLLIDLVRQHPAIYDKSHPDHFHTNLRNEIWDEIGKILSIPGKLNCFSSDLLKSINYVQATAAVNIAKNSLQAQCVLKSGRTLWIRLEERLTSQGLQECL